MANSVIVYGKFFVLLMIGGLSPEIILFVIEKLYMVKTLLKRQLARFR